MSQYQVAVVFDSLRRESLNRQLADALVKSRPADFSFQLKNAIDHASRPSGQSAWAGTPAGVLGVSIGLLGTAMAQQHLRNILAYLDVPTLGQPEAFIRANEGLLDQGGDIAASHKRFLQTWMDRFNAWVKLHTPAKAGAATHAA